MIPSFSISFEPEAVEESETWKRSGRHRPTHVFETPGRRLTEIFNFETRERITLSENLALKAETMGPRETFDTLSSQALARAFNEFIRAGGSAEPEHVFGKRLNDVEARPSPAPTR